MTLVAVESETQNIRIETPSTRRRMRVDTTSSLLDVFVAGEENRMVLECLGPELLSQLADLSPLIFVGPSGSGKTMLAMTMAARYLTQISQARDDSTTLPNVTVVTASDFSRQFSAAIEADDMQHFRRKHRECSALVIDALHEIVNKPRAQEELVLTIDALHAQRRPVICTSLRLPASMKELHLPLISRLSGGMSIPVSLPGEAARFAILRHLSKELTTPMSLSDLREMARNVASDTSAVQLRGMLASWSHQRRAHPESKETESLQMVLLAQHQQRIPEIADIAKITARHFRVKLSEMRSATRKSSIVRARGIAIHLARQLTPASLDSIGEYFGGRDHTTILHACRKTLKDIEADPELIQAAEEITERLRAK